MYRINYTNLNKKQVESILSKGTTPTTATAFCTRLAGKSLTIKLDKLPVEGPTLEYEFHCEKKLTLKENGGEGIECEYGALTLKDITLFSHMIPGTKKGYVVIVNWKTTVVTAFEMWFIDYEGKDIDTTKTFYDVTSAGALGAYLNREVQRQYYFGYFEEPGKTPPTERDKLSLQLENAMIEWKEDRGLHRLTTYTSTTYTTMVELDLPDGGDVLTFVADILQMDESFYIHCFGEVEYSGRLSVEVLDLFSEKKIGITMGIDENDEYEHVLYKGDGKYLGRYAAFYDFNDRGHEYSQAIAKRIDYSVKGARATYRPSIMAKSMSEEDITEASKNPVVFDSGRDHEAMMASSHVIPDTDYCAGKEITFRGDDDFVVDLKFKSGTEVDYCMGGETEWKTESYRAVELDEDLIVLGFYRTGSNPPASLNFAFDFKNGLATCIYGVMGSKYDLHDPVPSYHFGVMEIEGITPLRIFRHGFTDELLGYGFTQTYSDNMSSIHIYNAPHSYSWTIINNDTPGTPANRAGGYVWSSPCEYLKFRKDVYAMIWVEQKWSGGMCSLYRNLRTERECGFGYGVAHDGSVVRMHKMGAISRAAGFIDLKDYYPLRNYNVRS